jgi:hypothetical protein
MSTKAKYNNINVLVCPTSEEVAKAAAEHFIAQLQQKPNCMLVLLQNCCSYS